MSPRVIFISLLLWVLLIGSVAFPFVAIVPISTAVISYLAKDHIECFLHECCSRGVQFNQTALNYSLINALHGQHIASERVLHHISAHIRDKRPRKPLVLSFHGYTGVGKNFVSNLIATSLFKLGTKSRFFHFYDATIDFAHRSKVDEYKEKLYAELRKAAAACPTSIFVFDEMHHMPDGILDILAPLLDIREAVGGVDFRKSIFLFLSNTGGNYINRRLYDHLISGKRREELQYTDLDRFLSRSAFTDEGGLRYSELIQKHLITAMVPFLPLQEEHVKQCIQDVARQRNIQYTENLAQFVVQELEWAPEGAQMFSVSGCKRVYEKVGLYVEMH